MEDPNEFKDEVSYPIDIEYFIGKIIKDTWGSHWTIKDGRLCMLKSGKYRKYDEGYRYMEEYGEPEEHHTIFDIQLFTSKYMGVSIHEIGIGMEHQCIFLNISNRNYKKYFNEGICYTRNKNIDIILDEPDS